MKQSPSIIIPSLLLPLRFSTLQVDPQELFVGVQSEISPFSKSSEKYIVDALVVEGKKIKIVNKLVIKVEMKRDSKLANC